MRLRALALLASVLLVAPAAAAGAEYQLLFSEMRSQFKASGTAAEGETRGYRFVVLQANVSRVEFVLTWAETGDDARLSAPDELSLRAQDPDGRPVGSPQASRAGEVRLGRAVAPVPEDGPVAGDELAARVADATSSAGQGAWLAWVTVEDAGNPEGAPLDEGNDFELVAIVHYYEGTAMRVVSLGKPVGGSGLAGPDASIGVALAGLGVLAVALAVVLVVQARRRAASRAAATASDARP